MAEHHAFFNIVFRTLVAVCMALLPVVVPTAATPADDAPQVARITVTQVKERMNHPDTVVVDVRTYRNWWRSSKKIPTAVREDPSKVDQWFKKYRKNQTLIFYCS